MLHNLENYLFMVELPCLTGLMCMISSIISIRMYDSVRSPSIISAVESHPCSLFQMLCAAVLVTTKHITIYKYIVFAIVFHENNIY